MIMKARHNFLWLALILLSGCAPVLSQAVIDASNPNVSLEELQRNPERFEGMSVLFGGTIIQTGNDNAGSWVELLQRPLGHRLEPKLTDETGGRLLLKSNDIWDDQIFSKGRKITLVGKVTGTETRTVGETSYEYPVLLVTEYHLWKEGRARIGPDVQFSFGLFGSF
jgi:outer membrane lipoprotein